MRKEIIEKIEAVVNMAEDMKNAYFWHGVGNQSQRNYYDKKHSVDMVEWEEGDHTYTAEFTTRSSRDNIYAKGHYTKDGNKTTITAIRNSLKRLKAE